MKFEEILPDYVEKENEHYRAKVINETIVDCREKLEKAVSDGKLCLDPPDENEIRELCNKFKDCFEEDEARIQAISSRIRNGREE